MKLQLRFFLVLASIFLATAAFLLLQQKFEIDRSKSVLASELKQRKTYLQNIVNLDGQSEQTIDEDYSFWDQMVSFIKTDDVSFAQQNLDTGLSTFNVDADWVYRTNGTLEYFSSANGSNTLKPLQLSAAFFKQLSNAKFAHFYQWVNGNLVEIRAATVVPTSDPNHQTPAQGYLLFGRVLGSAYTKTISALSDGSTVSISKNTTANDTTTANGVSFSELFNNWNGQPVGSLRSTATVAVISDLRQQYHRQLELLAAVTILFAAIIIALVWWLVLRPVSLVNRAIAQQRPELLDRLKTHHTEFGRLAQTISTFFEQKVSLTEAEFKRDELEKLNKEKASFLAVAAHELNGPVANIKTFSEYLAFLLGKHADQKDIDTQVQRIQHQNAKVGMLLNDLRGAVSGKQDLEFNARDFDFDAFLKEEVAEAAFSIKNKLDVFCDTRATVHGDPDRLGQVVGNLIRNAVKYSPDGGSILIHGNLEDGQVVVVVQDFGVGVPPGDLPHLFERFYRSASVSKSFPGLGLGLYISKTIIEAMGGKIWVKSEVQKGSSFFFSLPIVTES